MWEKVSVKCLETKINIQHSVQMESVFFLCCRLINGKSKYNREKTQTTHLHDMQMGCYMGAPGNLHLEIPWQKQSNGR